jgi:hypothetical protein
MNFDEQEVSSGRARVNRLRWWWLRRMAWPGWVALLMIVLAGVLAWAVRPAVAKAHSELLQAHVAKLDRVSRERAALPATSQRDPRDQMRDSLPSVSRRGESLAALLEILDKGEVATDRAEYVAEDQEPGLVRLRIAMPVQGAYGPTRKLIADILNAMPNAALDRVELERPNSATNTLNGQLNLSLFFRREAP